MIMITQATPNDANGVVAFAIRGDLRQGKGYFRPIPL